MPGLLSFSQWIEQTSVAAAIRQSLWLFPVLETVHLLGMILFIAAITVVDLRLLGWTLKDRQASAIAGRFLRLAWIGFVAQVITGSLLFSSEAVKLYGNPAFELKLLLIALAGANALIFHFTTYRKVAKWDQAISTPAGAKIAGSLSLLLWIGVVTAGRFIGFV